MAFEQTLDALAQKNHSIDSFLLKHLREGGVALDFCDIWCDLHGIYLLLNDNTLIKIFIHQGILTDREFQTHGVPLLHIAPCESVKALLQSPQKKNYFASVASSNAFTYKIAGRRAALRVYQDAPLTLCTDCLALLGLTNERAQNDLESLCSSLYAPSEISQPDYDSLMTFFKQLFGNRCAVCKHEVSEDSLLLSQNIDGAFFLICNAHQEK